MSAAQSRAYPQTTLMGLPTELQAEILSHVVGVEGAIRDFKGFGTAFEVFTDPGFKTVEDPISPLRGIPLLSKLAEEEFWRANTFRKSLSHIRSECSFQNPHRTNIRNVVININLCIGFPERNASNKHYIRQRLMHHLWDMPKHYPKLQSITLDISLTSACKEQEELEPHNSSALLRRQILADTMQALGGLKEVRKRYVKIR